MPGKIVGACLVCTLNDAVYRCPKCTTIYCSLVCYKNHKDSCKVSNETHTKSATDETTELVQPPLRFTEEENETDRIKYETLKKLGQSNHLKRLLSNTHLREMMQEIDSSRSPNELLEKAMHIPIFTEFVDECLTVVEPDDVDEQKAKEMKELERIKQLLDTEMKNGE